MLEYRNGRMPISTATNSYDLLGDLIEVVREEPRRLLMTNWVTFLHGEKVDEFIDVYGCPIEIDKPECGTVACASGILGLIRRTKEYTPHQLRSGDMPYSDDLHTALRSLFYTYPDNNCGPSYGTKEYAEVVIGSIKGVMAEFEEILKVHTLKPLGEA